MTRTLFLALVLRLRVYEGHIGNGIPCVMDTDEEKQHRSGADDEQRRRRIARYRQRRDNEGRVGDERKDRMPQPVFQHRLIVGLMVRPPDDDDNVYHPCQTSDAQQKASIPERWPGRAENRGDEERGAKMHDVRRGECPGCLTRPLPPP